MILRILIELLPALVPIALYLLWLWVKKKSRVIDANYQELDPNGQPKFGGKNQQNSNFSLQNRQFVLVLYLSFFIAIICFLFFAIRVPKIEQGQYIPAHLENGQVVPAKIVK